MGCNKGASDVPEKRDQIRQESRVKRLAVLEGDSDMFRPMVLDVGVNCLQVVVEILAFL